MKKHAFILIFLILGFVFYSCNKKEQPVLNTPKVHDVTFNTATVDVSIVDDGGSDISQMGVCWSTSQGPTISNVCEFASLTQNSFTIKLKNLLPNSNIYLRAFARNNVGLSYSNEVVFKTKPSTNKVYLNPYIPYGSVTDIGGRSYATVSIGNQVWMAENLSTSKFSNGDSIPMVYDNLPWQQATVIQSPAACFYNNDSINDTPMGKLYNWYAVIDSRNVCPSGWHIPSDAEWSQLIVHLDSLTIVGDDVESSLVGAQIKSTGLQFWLAPNTGAVNQSGFSALPGGKRPATGLYYPIFEYYSYYGYFWSSTSSQTPGLAYDRYLDYASTAILRTTSPKGEGKSVRCVKD